METSAGCPVAHKAKEVADEDLADESKEEAEQEPLPE